MLTCKQMSEIAPDYLDKQVSFLKAMEIKIHSAICPDCRRYLKQLALAFEFLSPQIVAKTPPEELRQKLLTELQRRQQEQTGSSNT